MTTRPKRKVTYSLPEGLVNDIAQVVSEGAAPSYSAFVEEALSDAVKFARERALGRAFADAASDPAFLDDIETAMDDFRYADSETEGSGS